MAENNELRRLIERAWSLHDCISHDVAADENPSEPRLSLLLIRDSVMEVKDMLILLQRMRWRQKTNREAAIARLEESRAMLIEKMTEYQESGREVGVVEELNALFSEKRVEAGFVMSYINSVLNPCKWRTGFGVAMKVALVLATISCALHARKLPLGRRNNKQTGTEVAVSSRALDVFHGRG